MVLFSRFWYNASVYVKCYKKKSLLNIYMLTTNQNELPDMEVY